MSTRTISLLVTLALISSCGGGGDNGDAGADASPDANPSGCATDIEVGEVQNFGDATPTRSEGLTFDALGHLFVSAQNDADDQLLQYSPDGTFNVVAEAESILGLAAHSSGILAAGIATGDLLSIDVNSGESTAIAEDVTDAPNFVVPTPWGTVLVSDDTPDTTIIYEVTFAGEVSIWLDGVPTPNGMVFSLDEQTLYVAATFMEQGLWRVPVLEGGEAGTPDKWIEFPVGSTPDGVAIDSTGNVYVALNLAGQVARVAPDGTVTTLASDILGVASLAFGVGEFDACSLYASNLFGTQLWRIGAGVLGD